MIQIKRDVSRFFFSVCASYFMGGRRYQIHPQQEIHLLHPDVGELGDVQLSLHAEHAVSVRKGDHAVKDSSLDTLQKELQWTFAVLFLRGLGLIF